MNFYTEDIANGYNWKGLERAIARMMEHLGWRDINVIGGAGDKGGDVGKIIIEYMPKERVRTYIKDGILNAYTKAATKRALAGSTPANTIQTVFNETASVIQEGKGKQSGLFVLRSESGNIYVVSGGTVLKWETALRKALEIIANEPNLTLNGIAPSICLKLSVAGQSLTEADKAHIIAAVGAVGVRAVFCKA